jgi:hypothetical protein
MSDICQVDLADIDVVELAGLAFEIFGVELSPAQLQALRDVTPSECKAYFISTGQIGSDDENSGRLLFGDEEKETAGNDGKKRLIAASSSHGGRMLANTVVVNSTRPMFNVTFRITPSANSKIVLQTPRDQNVLILIQAKVAAAMQKAATVEGLQLFPRAIPYWTDQLNVSNWNANSMFADSAVKPFSFIPGAAAAQGPPDSSGSNQDKLPIILGTTLGLCCGAALIALIVALIVSRRRRRRHEQQVLEAEYQAAQQKQYIQQQQQSGMIAVASVVEPGSSPRQVFPVTQVASQ